MPEPLHRLTKVYRRLLACYPRPFREQFSAEMQQVFSQSITDAAAHGTTAVLLVCLAELRDWPGQLWFQHYQNWVQNRRSPMLTNENPIPGLLPVSTGAQAGFSFYLTKHPRLRRGFDIFFALFLLILFSPLMLIIAVIVPLDSPGPVLFHQPRLGKNKQVYMLLKFRTMTHPPAAAGGHKEITRFGRVIRRLYLDEIPQLLNVLAGHVSIFGPRPQAVV